MEKEISVYRYLKFSNSSFHSYRYIYVLTDDVTQWEVSQGFEGVGGPADDRWRLISLLR
jgi:hypothetical protein